MSENWFADKMVEDMDAIKLIMLAGLITEIEIAAILLMFTSSSDDRVQRSIALLLMFMGLYYTGLLIHLFWGMQNFTLLQLLVKDFPLLTIPVAANILIEKNVETIEIRTVKLGFFAVAAIYPMASSFLYYNARLTESVGVLNTLAILLQTLLAGGSAAILYFVFSKKIVGISTQFFKTNPLPSLVVFLLAVRFFYSSLHLLYVFNGDAPRYLFPSYSMMELSLLTIGINFFIATSFKFNADEKRNKYAYSKLGREDKVSLLASVESLMRSEKLYLKPDLTLEELGQLLQKPSKQISQVLNELKKLNFNEFLNHYRVEEAKQLLSGDHIKTKTLEWVQEKAGFGSKSAFFSAFKTIVGVTPSEYKGKKKLH